MTPEQLRQNINSAKAEEKALLMVIAQKRRCAALLDDVEGNIAAGNLSAALSNFSEIQRIEYALVIGGFEERLNMVQAFLKGAESPAPVPRPAMRVKL